MSKIKLFAMGMRRPDMSREEFHDYWRHPHGTWGRNMTTLRGYVQSHQMDTEFLGRDQAKYEAVAEMWLDNLKDLDGFSTEPVFVKYLIEDEPRFSQQGETVFFATEEEVLTSGPPQGAQLNPGDDVWVLSSRPFSTKLLHFAGPSSGRHWSSPEDEALGLQLGALRHVRCHPVGDAPPFLGVQELWWPTVRAFRAGVSAAPDAFRALIRHSSDSITLLAQAERFS